MSKLPLLSRNIPIILRTPEIWRWTQIGRQFQIIQTKPNKLNLQKNHQIISTKEILTKPNLQNQTYRTKPSKPTLPYETYQTKPTKQNLPNPTKWTYQAKSTTPILQNEAYQTKPTKPNLLYQPFQKPQNKSSSAILANPNHESIKESKDPIKVRQV